MKKKCIICGSNPDAKNSHIVPMNVIKECIGGRNNEVSYEIEILNNKFISAIYIGNDLKHKSAEINNKDLKIIDCNPYTLDYILCLVCERKLGEIEGKVYSEIVCKIREDRYKDNFNESKINGFDVIVPFTKKITKDDLNIYFYSIVIRVICFLKIKGLNSYVDKSTQQLISSFLKAKMYGLSENCSNLETGLLVYITNDPKNQIILLESNKFEKLIIPTCQFYIVFEPSNINTPFGDCVNKINNTDFKFLKNSIDLDFNLFSTNRILE
jgi:hypothetical protein